ncbi:MAG: alpha/beta fold hydrolase [Rhodospirillaceae bacterium]|nr:alpha/beta fold hydrolase [Rhodospirillaceae bacterium]MBT5239567.1 alpha/beta fold hydrolase [Rhodospirillaceae bacterium]MBT5564153.1 alpha/beta fold hydrolase [Rhodospirillaceae bacterium]MBT6089948.1 alpha/beta fold hydrolase [Rhodospirillaceae bacterium]
MMSHNETTPLSRRTLVTAVSAGAAASLIGRGSVSTARADGHEGGEAYSMTRGYADGPFGQVHYQDVSPSNPKGLPLILLHQAPMTLRQFDSILAPLAERGVRSISIDTPGFGQSAPPDFVPTVEDYATAIPAVLDHLGLEQVDLLGHHTGAMIATSVALQFPDRINNLIINGPFPMTDEERAGFLARNKTGERDFVHEHDGTHVQNSFLGRYRMYGEGVDPKLITRYTAEKFIGLGPFWYGHHAAFQYNHNVDLPKIKHRTLLLTNTGDQIYENAKWAKKMRPDLDYVAIEGGGVDIVDQMPEEWSDVVVGFLHG